MSRKNTKLLFEGWRRFINEEADPSKIPDDKFPLLLSAVNKEVAQQLVQSGTPPEDVVPVKAGQPFACAELKPSQTSMDINKAWQFALSMMNGTMPGSGGAGGELGSFISNDNYIMDGHHRWIATGMVDPSAKISGYFVSLPGKKLIAVLNTITKGLLGQEQGNPGTGGFEQFKQAESLKKGLELQINKQAGDKQGPIKGNPDEIKSILSKWCGEKDENKVVDAAVAKVLKNLGTIPMDILPGAPDRADMPVIDDKKTPKATEKTIDALQKGKVDVNPPFKSGGGQEKAAPVKEALLRKKIRATILNEMKKRG